VCRLVSVWRSSGGWSAMDAVLAKQLSQACDPTARRCCMQRKQQQKVPTTPGCLKPPLQATGCKHETHREGGIAPADSSSILSSMSANCTARNTSHRRQRMDAQGAAWRRDVLHLEQPRLPRLLAPPPTTPPRQPTLGVAAAAAAAARAAAKLQGKVWRQRELGAAGAAAASGGGLAAAAAILTRAKRSSWR
jgi:hypothetical protein